MKQPASLDGMQELLLTVVYHNNREVDDDVAYNCEAFAKVLKETGLVK